ncbi:Ti type entry exclusion protein TrbK [Bradyrhizobium sp. USDA 4524]|uniref:entry exclusion protein TrbK n=1 Tax=unclassified Bradyrhizobium TaxID=2631580 RepID=UPI0020A0037B|nr:MULTISPECIES: entry exclusion protein TrbK [unclassified Bradyrhizobium]MCP1845854.1 Ti type entry exclusion protein TrbK [Bradyrhizobium sp. USDA 4538]MCP1907512.1 Ti type entry exclusion protein TrbK [Bradyrhizobium sp. USDA 4537]MCP1985298.1 Ti type entry exclusion protein TrbK [Bradyrhizobium sp. USDA 4539]
MRSSTIIIVVIAIGACAAGAWVFFARRGPVAGQGTESRASDFFKPTQDYKTSGGQQMKPRW